MSDHGALALIIVVGAVIELGVLGVIIWMVRDFYKEVRRGHGQLEGVMAANFLQGRQVKEVVEEMRRLLAEGRP